MNNITQSTVLDLLKENRDTLSYGISHIQEYQIDTEDGEPIATLELYWSDDGYIYNIVFTDESNGNSKQFYGKEGDELAQKLLEGENPLIDTI